MTAPQTHLPTRNLTIHRWCLFTLALGACHAFAATELLSPEAMDPDPPEGGFEGALRLEVDFSATEDPFIGQLFNPLTPHLTEEDEELRVWMHVEGSGPMFVAKLRLFRGPDFVDLPVAVEPHDFGNWVCVPINVDDAVPEEKRHILQEITGCYFFTHRPWLGDGSHYMVHIASIQGAKISDPH